MKKYLLFLIGIFSIFLINDNVYALTYDKCGEIIEVDNTNFIYYLYKNYSSYWESNSNYYFTAFADNSNTYYLAFNPSYQSNWSAIKNTSSYNNKIYIYANTGTRLMKVGAVSGTLLQDLSNVNSTLTINNVDYLNLVTNASWAQLYGVNVPNLTKQDLEEYFLCVEPVYTITYYLNNEVYNSFEINKNGSHTLLYYEPSIEYEFSGWSYDSNIDLTNIQSNVNIYGTTTLKPTYTISYYLNEELYNSVSVLKGTNYTIQDYIPPRHYTFSGWSYDSNIDLTNITSNVLISGTTEYVVPNIEYTEEYDSIIHSITLKIVGEGVPQEFDFIYTIFDLLLLLVLVITIISPFILLFKLLGVI